MGKWWRMFCRDEIQSSEKDVEVTRKARKNFQKNQERVLERVQFNLRLHIRQIAFLVFF